MKQDPRYVDDPFSDHDLSFERHDWANLTILKQMFLAVGRKRLMFQSDTEMVRLEKLDEQITLGLVPVGWIESRCKFAEEHYWSYARLVSAVTNTAKMEAWVRMQKPKEVEEVHPKEASEQRPREASSDE